MFSKGTGCASAVLFMKIDTLYYMNNIVGSLAFPSVYPELSHLYMLFLKKQRKKNEETNTTICKCTIVIFFMVFYW